MDPYDPIAELYEAEYGALEADCAFFSRRGLGGSLLVLGCGTGRVCRRLVENRPVVGLDRSAGMLAVARHLDSRSRYVQGDMRAFDLGTFAEVIVPNASFAFLTSRADQQRCLAACRRALPPGGVLNLDLPMPVLGRWDERHTPEEPAWEGLSGGRTVRRTRETWRSLARQRLDLVDRYYAGDECIAVSDLHLRVVFPAEAEWMLEAAGFYADEIAGDYAGGALGDDSPRLIVRAVAS